MKYILRKIIAFSKKSRYRKFILIPIIILDSHDDKIFSVFLKKNLCTQREILGFTDQSFFVKIVFTKILKFS